MRPLIQPDVCLYNVGIGMILVAFALDNSQAASSIQVPNCQ